jgi:Spy/CpxP family protein refolding chaperone
VDSQGQYTRNRRGPYEPIEAVWSYSAPKKSDFYSFFISGAQRLPNGNTLICSGASGTIFEVTPDKEVVWKYANPVMGNPGGPGGPGRSGGVDLFPFFVRDQLDLTREQSKQIEDFQKELTDKLNKTLNDAQQKQVRDINPFGPGGFAALPLPGQIVSKSTLTAIKPSPEQQSQLDDLQKEVDAKLDKLLNADQKKQLREARENFGKGSPFGRPPGGPPPGGPGGPPGGGPGGPPRGPGGPIMGNTLFRAYRYGPDFPGLAGTLLKPGKTIEEMEAVKKANEAKKSQETAKK